MSSSAHVVEKGGLRQARSPTRLRWASGALALARQRPGFAIAASLLLVVIVLAVFAPWFGTVDPRAIAPVRRLRAPSAENWFGTDALGRDLYSRVLYGARISLIVGFTVSFLSSVIGTLIGVVSASDRRLDAVIMRLTDGLMSIPAILLAIALMAVTRGSVATVVMAITIVEVPRVARVIRGAVLKERELPYVEAAITCGATWLKITRRHLLPAIVAPLVVQATFVCAAAMLIESVLSFIGAGTPPTIPSWGNIMADGRALWQIKPNLVFIPAAFLSLTVLAVNTLGDHLRDMLDPRSAKRL